jgi:hypothetical protein
MRAQPRRGGHESRRGGELLGIDAEHAAVREHRISDAPAPHVEQDVLAARVEHGAAGERAAAKNYRGVSARWLSTLITPPPERRPPFS